ncbi:MAG: hypothetical protein H6807_01040 [Planctomycetes bacterium]|nr:hypothetical protein [Planctomycetota bacterium]
MQPRSILAWALVALVILQAPALAVWKQVDTYYAPTDKVSRADARLPYWSKEAWAVTSAGKTVGWGKAHAVSPRRSVTWTVAPKNGLASTFWVHVRPGVGEVEVVAKAEIDSSAEVKGPGEGRAAAFGYSEASFAIDGLPTVVLVRASSAVATTTVEGTPSLNLTVPFYRGGPSVGISQPVIFRNGSGEVPDGERDRRFRVACPVLSFETRERSGSTVYVWALGSPARQKGRAECEIEGDSEILYYFLTHPISCP